VLAAELVTSLRDTNAHVLIPGFYDDVRPLTASEKTALGAMPDVDDLLKRELGLAATESSGELVQQAIMRPALNIRGIMSGHVGDKAQNAIPTEATVSIDFRLVPNQTPEHVRAQLEAFLKQKGFTVVREAPDAEVRRARPRLVKVTWPEGSYVPARTDMDLPIVHSIVGAIEATLGTKIIATPMLGGSIPMYLFLDGLHTPVVGVPISNHDDTQHGPNENVRVQNLWDGIEIFAGLLTAPLKS
jgi:acetylornithine deacetylase/succinyl-diaminopimelate desuccinylase-like protein